MAQDKIAPAATTTCGVAGKYAPRCGALWGVYTLQNGNPETAVTRLESQVGRKFDLTLRYHDFSTHQRQGLFPDIYERRLGQTRTLFMSWQARVSDTNKNLSWRAIANGSYDRYINSAATRMKAFDRPVFIAFDAEFDTHKTKGTIADYVAAYRRVVEQVQSLRRHQCRLGLGLDRLPRCRQRRPDPGGLPGRRLRQLGRLGPVQLLPLQRHHAGRRSSRRSLRRTTG